MNQTGSSSCAILEQRFAPREWYRGTGNPVAETLRVELEGAPEDLLAVRDATLRACNRELLNRSSAKHEACVVLP